MEILTEKEKKFLKRARKVKLQYINVGIGFATIIFFLIIALMSKRVILFFPVLFFTLATFYVLCIIWNTQRFLNIIDKLEKNISPKSSSKEESIKK